MEFSRRPRGASASPWRAHSPAVPRSRRTGPRTGSPPEVHLRSTHTRAPARIPPRVPPTEFPARVHTRGGHLRDLPRALRSTTDPPKGAPPERWLPAGVTEGLTVEETPRRRRRGRPPEGRAADGARVRGFVAASPSGFSPGRAIRRDGMLVESPPPSHTSGVTVSFGTDSGDPESGPHFEPSIARPRSTGGPRRRGPPRERPQYLVVGGEINAQVLGKRQNLPQWAMGPRLPGIVPRSSPGSRHEGGNRRLRPGPPSTVGGGSGTRVPRRGGGGAQRPRPGALAGVAAPSGESFDLRKVRGITRKR